MVEYVFFKGKGDWKAKLIRAWTRSPHSHCEIHFGGGLCFSSAPGEGTRWKTIDLSPDAWDRVPIPTLDAYWEKLHDWCISEEGCAYDWRGIAFSEVLPLGWHSKDKWFCSEICVAAAQQFGLFPGIDAWTISPGGLYRRAIGAWS